MDHKELVGSLSAETRAALLMRSDMAGLAHLAVHWGLILICGLYIGAGLPGWWALVLPQGLLIVFCFTLQHECVHKTPFRSEWLNELVMHVCAVLICLPPAHFRFFHLAHHKYTNDPARDPELEGAQPDTWRRFCWTVSGMPVWAYHLGVVVRNARGRCEDGYVPATRRAALRHEARAMLLVYGLAGAAMAAGEAWLFWAWWLPALLGQPFLRLYLMAEHGRCPQVANMLENSRTTLTNRFVRFLAWNMPFHAEHHAYPNVPFHRLPAFHALAAPHIRRRAEGYVAYHREAGAARGTRASRHRERGS